ncbi:MAG: leucine-rich repeat protein [Bacillota bacterium]|nr:leucine-rich repeat protein [Bacillota bacterium]
MIKYKGSQSDVVIPDSVMKIEHDTFGNCSSLKSIVIPESVIQIGRGNFEESQKQLTFYGTPNSYAQLHAKNYAIKFSDNR